jgi:hypothetical protein
MKSFIFSPIACLLVFLVTIAFPEMVSAQTNTIQSASPALEMPSKSMPTGAARAGEVMSTTSEAIGGQKPVDQALPDAAGEVQTTSSEIKRQLTAAEIEELKDGK